MMSVNFGEPHRKFPKKLSLDLSRVYLLIFLVVGTELEILLRVAVHFLEFAGQGQ